VADGLSKKVQDKYGDELHVFQDLDFLETVLPSAELFITKDVLQHLPNNEIIKLLASLTSYESIIICNDIYVGGGVLFEIKEFVRIRQRYQKILNGESPFFRRSRFNNSNIVGGQFRGIDLEKKPFKGVLKEMTLTTSFDYDGPRRRGIKKKVYCFRQKSV
jgi:hypothetical protein